MEDDRDDPPELLGVDDVPVKRLIDKAPPEQRSAYLDQHIGREIRTLIVSAEMSTEKLMLSIHSSPNDRESAIIARLSYEALLVHARLLRDFFAGRGNRDDDVWASDFIPEWDTIAQEDLIELNKVYKKEHIEEKINKQLMHLSFQRDKYSHGYPAEAFACLKKLAIMFFTQLPAEHKNASAELILQDLRNARV